MKRPYILCSVFAFCALLFSACNKDEMDFGHDYLNKSDLVRAFIDSSTTFSTTTRLDSALRSTNLVYMLGNVQVPGFSTSKASFLCRYYFKGFAVNLTAPDIVLEKIILRLRPNKQFSGDTAALQEFKISELTSVLTREIVADYFDKGIRPTALITSATLLGTKTYSVENMLDSAKDFQFEFPATRALQLFVQIQSFYKQVTDKAAERLQDSALNAIFKGLYIQASQGAAIINYSTRIEIHTNKGIAYLEPSAIAYDDASTSVTDADRKLYVQALSVFDHVFTSNVKSSIGVATSPSYAAGFMAVKSQLNFNDFDRWKDSAVVFNAVNVFVPITLLNAANTLDSPTKTPYLRISNADKSYVFDFVPTVGSDGIYNFNITPFMSVLRRGTAKASEYSYEIIMPSNNRYGNAFAIDAANERTRVEIRYSR
ncbi:MAG: hypothetical protein LBU90_05330 [Bacteroidales bacterium]|jgi:hypothetical protein|nr:hypothetical protein [Bacteroidales bacterium]